MFQSAICIRSKGQLLHDESRESPIPITRESQQLELPKRKANSNTIKSTDFPLNCFQPFTNTPESWNLRVEALPKPKARAEPLPDPEPRCQTDIAALLVAGILASLLQGAPSSGSILGSGSD
ncbi:hypothetical protein J6590_070026 [Homalodisca vitripennis]|nr:hypothetical protein J6590_015018 [Homalodisca vitripennis]KAG8256374.1 hypothetical protein J6590_070026 [Homalodisca vitripennis]